MAFLFKHTNITRQISENERITSDGVSIAFINWGEIDVYIDGTKVAAEKGLVFGTPNIFSWNGKQIYKVTFDPTGVGVRGLSAIRTYIEFKFDFGALLGGFSNAKNANNQINKTC